MLINLSIIIPHFNISDMLETLLASIPHNKEIQIIVVDDKSDLSHLKKIDQLKNKYNFEFYQNNKIKSAGSSRNFGLKKALGKWILFADSDDYFLDEFYTLVSRYFDSENDVIFFCPTSVLNDTHKIADRHLHYKNIIEMNLLNKSKKNELFLRYKFSTPCSKIIKNKFIQKYRLNFDEVLYGNDVMFNTKLGHFMQNFEVSSDVIYCITRRYGSLTSDIRENVFNERFDRYLSYYMFLNKILPKKELDILRLDYALLSLLKTTLFRHGFKNFLRLISILNKKNIKWFRIKYLSPFMMVKMILHQFRNHIDSKKFNNYYLK